MQVFAKPFRFFREINEAVLIELLLECILMILSCPGGGAYCLIPGVPSNIRS